MHNHLCFARRDLLLSLLAKRSRTCPPQEQLQREDPLDSPETGLARPTCDCACQLTMPITYLGFLSGRRSVQASTLMRPMRAARGGEWFHSHFAEVLFSLPARKASYRNPGRVSLYHFTTAVPPHFQVEPALDDAKQVLSFWVFVRCDASIEPSDRTFHGFFHAYMIWGCRLYYIVELHNDIGTNRVLQ